MGVDLDYIGSKSEPFRWSWTERDVILYALGVGAAAEDPLGPELALVTENTQGRVLQPLPTFATLAYGRGPKLILEAGTFTRTDFLHGAQGLTIHHTMPVRGSLVATIEIVGIWDKGQHAMIETETVAILEDSGEPLFTSVSTTIVRGAGGFGLKGGRTMPPAPQREPDFVVDVKTRLDQPLLYRLLGDDNPIHSDPQAAVRAGFERPILHGLCTFGVVGRAMIASVAGGDPALVRSIEGRFCRPMYPGADATLAGWEVAPGAYAFEVRGSTGERTVDRGSFTLV